MKRRKRRAPTHLHSGEVSKCGPALVSTPFLLVFPAIPPYFAPYHERRDYHETRLRGRADSGGTKITLQAGVPVVITQALGGSYTIIVHGNMARIASADADALGQEVAASTVAAAPGKLTEEQVTEVLRTLLRSGDSGQHRRTRTGL